LAGLLTSAGQSHVQPDGRGDDGRPAVALVAGEAGIGKTRLLRELMASVPPGTVVLGGQAEHGSLGRPYELLRSMLGDVPFVGDDPARAAVAAIESRLGEGPALVVFEDLHWADAESMAVFERLAGLPRPSLLLVGTYRPDELTRRVPASEVFVRLERRHQVHQLRLDRLRRPEVATFLTSVYHRSLPSTVTDALFNRTGGNPFFLEEILVAAGDVEPEHLCTQPLPWSLAELVQRNLDGLSNEERRVVEAAAVLGRHAPFDVLAAMTSCSEDELIAHLRGLVERGLLLEEDDDEFSFRHALVRDAVEGQLLGRERRRLHAMALTALTQACCADLAQLARHAAGAGEYDQLVELAREGVIHYLDRGSSHQALVLAVEALPEAPDDLVLLEAAARAAWLTGHHEEALPHAERWVALSRAADDPVAQSGASRLLARLYHEIGDDDAVWAMASGIEALTERLPPGEERAKNLASLAQMHMLAEHPEEAIRWAELAIEEADAFDAKPVRAQAMVERGSAMADLPGRAAEGEEVLRQAIDEAEAVGDWLLVSRALNNMVKYLPAEAPENVELVARMRAAADLGGFDLMRAYASLRSARHAIAVGDMPRSRARVDEAAELLATDGHKGVWIAHLHAFLLLEEGRLDAAEATLEHMPPTTDHEMITWRAGLRLTLAGLRGARHVPPDLDEMVGATSTYSFPMEALEALHDDIESAIRLGLDADAIEARILPRWAEKNEWPDSHRRVNDAVLAAHRGHHEEAVAGLTRSLDELAELHLPIYRQASIRVLLARSLAACGRRADALGEALAARRLLAQWPGWRRDEADALIAALEGAPPDDDTGLSPREREVAALLAEGLSNAELARRLYISPKTAAVHVSNILAKLGMSSRAEVAAWAVRTGLAAGGLNAG
jgi:DNA-binding CsgD family transcriptional regulator